MTTPHDSLIQQIASHCGLPFDLLQGQVMAESSGDPFAFRFEASFLRFLKGNPNRKTPAKYGPLAACSFGLLQILLETAYEIGFMGRPEDLFVPEFGLMQGGLRMTQLLKEAGGYYPLALACYNGGPALLHVQPSAWPAGPTAYVADVYKRSGRTEVQT